MCLAIFKPKGASIKKKYLRNGFEANEDGAGFAYVRDNAVIIQKGYFTFKEFYSAFKEFNTAKEVAIVHFRFATHGMANQENCHPFSLCGGKYAVIHNGIIDIECTDKARSDTAHFAELVLQPMLESGVAVNCGALRYLVETSIGGANKIVVLASEGSHMIFNESEGEWTKGCWYSNSGYRYGGWSLGRLTEAYTGYGGGSMQHPAYNAKYEPMSKAERDALDWAWNEHAGNGGLGSAAENGREYSYDSETNRWEERSRKSAIHAMSEADWRKEQAEELNAALQGEEENEAYCG